jgi:hypothetical protein
MYLVLSFEYTKIICFYLEKLFQMRRNLILEAKRQQRQYSIVWYAISKDWFRKIKKNLRLKFFTVETTAESIVFAYVYTCVYAVSSSSA